MFETWLHTLLAWLALPQYGLATVFVVSFVSATLIPLGSEPFVFGMVKLRPDWFWPVILVATLGNTLGALVNYAIGYGAHRAYARHRPTGQLHHAHAYPDAIDRSASAPRITDWLERYGPATCALAWLPVIGDPICGVAGWFGLPFWRCAAWTAVGKFLRYVLLTASLVWVF